MSSHGPRSGVAAVAWAIILATACSRPPNMPSDEIPLSPSSRVSPLESRTTALRPGPVGQTTGTPFPRIWSHRFGDGSQSSRSFASAAAGRWRIVRETPLFPETETDGLLATPDRLVVLGRVWQIFDPAGKTLATGLRGPGEIALSAEGDALVAIDATSALRRYRLDTGALQFRVGTGRGEGVLYSLVGARGADHVLAGAARALDPHGLNRPRSSYLQVFRCPAPVEVDESGLLLRSASEQEWEVPEPTLIGALEPDTVVFARPGQIFVTDLELSTLRSWSGSFWPRALSTDGAGTVHLVVEAERGLRYWRVSAGGLLTVDLPLGPGRSPGQPPVVDRDGRAFVRTEKEFVVVGPDGVARTSLFVRDPMARLVAQPDGSLLMTDGPDLTRLETDLRAMRLLRLERETFAGPPIPLDAGRVMAVTATRLLVLEKEP